MMESLFLMNFNSVMLLTQRLGSALFLFLLPVISCLNMNTGTSGGFPGRIEPKPGQESVWDYPRPPRLEPSPKSIKVVFNGEIIAQSTSSYRILETSHPPVYYIPTKDIKMEYLTQNDYQTYCEWKGMAKYFDVSVKDKTANNAGWFYTNPPSQFSAMKDFVAFYPNRMEACYVNDEQVIPQAGDFYGSWITKDIVGPFKGGPGTQGW